MAVKKNKDSGIVYSTEHGKMCSGCGRPSAQCRCHIVKSDGIVRIGRETKGRKGKCVTLITGLPLEQDQLLKLAQYLKQKFGTGGIVRNCVIELQGEHRDALAKEFKQRGYTVKKCGG